VSYTVERLTPLEVHGPAGWDVIVVDGESFPDERERLALLRRLDTPRPRVSSVVFVCSRLPLERELEQAAVFCDDWILPGWAYPERVRRRVQVIARALAPADRDPPPGRAARRRAPPGAAPS